MTAESAAIAIYGFAAATLVHAVFAALLLDLKILFETVQVVLTGRGAR